jgi:group I intron endonuclease
MIIYKITNNIRTLKEIVSEHKRKRKPLISKALKKYGLNNFTIDVIDKAETIEELNEKEYKWVEFYNCITPLGYNQCEGGDNTMGYHHKEESKKNMSIKKKKMYLGEGNPFYGKTHSDEVKAKFSQQRKGRTLSNQWKDNLGKAHFKKVINLDTGEIFDSIRIAAEKYGLKDTHITRVCKGKRKTTGGFRWQHYDEYKAISCQA